VNQNTSKLLVGLFIKVLGVTEDDLMSGTSLARLGVNSINAIALLESINSALALTLPTSILFECHNYEELRDSVVNAMPKEIVEGQKASISIESFASRSEPSSEDSTARAPKERLDDDNGGPVATGWTKRARNYDADRPLPRRVSTGRLSADADASSEKNEQKIAIVGLSCRSAGANNQWEFWRLIADGTSVVRYVGVEHWRKYSRRNEQMAEASDIGGFMSDADKFDPLFFGISPREAEAMDPAQRVLLEECYAAIEDAGYNPHALAEQNVAVIMGSMNSHYASDASHYSLLGLETSVLSARLSYFLNLKGPAITINTACSSSLVAVDVACEKLRAKSADLALAGGVTIYSTSVPQRMMESAGMISASGRCQPFDDGADGIVIGDGVGVVVLKRLSDALRDRDNIYAIIESIGTNQDGRTAGLTVPSFMAQSALEQRVYRDGAINPENIEYLEAHGTGTKLGDPVEFHALIDAFSKFTVKKQFCALGALKANIGHTTAAAGVLGMIKAVLAIKHKQLPPSVNFKQENRHIDFANSPFYINRSLCPWTLTNGGPRRAAVSAFGFSGTNAHAVLAEHFVGAEARRLDMSRSQLWIVPISAKSEEQLEGHVSNILTCLKRKQVLEENLEQNITDAGMRWVQSTVYRIIYGKPAPTVFSDHSPVFNGLDAESLRFASTAVGRYFQLPQHWYSIAPEDSVQSITNRIIKRHKCEVLKNCAEEIGEQSEDSILMDRLSYTLQVGRDAMKCRAAFEASSFVHLVSELEAFLAGTDSSNQSTPGLNDVLSPTADTETVREWIRERDVKKIAHHWKSGGAVEWELLYRFSRPIRMSLPSYPFERSPFWLDGDVTPASTTSMDKKNRSSNGGSIGASISVKGDQESEILKLAAGVSDVNLGRLLREALQTPARGGNPVDSGETETR
jgi:3-oxoacyl-(acyl-carrier-protein) synthase